MTTQAPKLGILAGGGSAPQRVLEMVLQAGRSFTLIGLEGQADPSLGDGLPCHWLPLGAGARLVELLRNEAVEEVVFIGRVRRPSLFELRPDGYTMQKLLKIGFNMLGDDGLLRGVEKIFADEGFRVVGVQDIFTQFLTPAGQLGAVAPSAQDKADMQRAAQIARQLGSADVGQAVIVQQGLVLGLEAIEGTDALIARAGGLKRAGGGGVLVKMCKPQQDRRLDLPTIGLATMQAVQAAGLAGIAAEAGNSLFFDREAALAAADAAGLFVCGYADGAAS
ncbi:MAG: UDP-2,3-diacylglucosamine diphosphatase LpxI [Alphaproteobacteria bacterium]|nr:UDP-2,3-diacylglucosamine diphosphatase LpxI [Alphaproteobacteria bacterium]